MTTQASKNGQRKSLAEQLDRLDAILDVLGEGLNEAVALAVQEAVTLAVKQAVKVAVTEVLTNPDVLQRLRGAPVATAVPAPAPTTLTQRLKGWCSAVAGAAKAAWNGAGGAVVRRGDRGTREEHLPGRGRPGRRRAGPAALRGGGDEAGAQAAADRPGRGPGRRRRLLRRRAGRGLDVQRPGRVRRLAGRQ